MPDRIFAFFNGLPGEVEAGTRFHLHGSDYIEISLSNFVTIFEVVVYEFGQQER